MVKDHYKGFVMGILYTCARMKKDNMDYYDVIVNSNIPLEDFLKYGEEIDLEDLDIEDIL